MRPPRQPKTRPNAFTLTEVSIAIAVAGIALFSVVGIMPALLDSDEKSSANSIVPTLATQAIALVKAQRATSSAGSTPLPATYSFQFTQDGAQVPSNHLNALFNCEVTLDTISHSAANHGGLTLPDPGDHCLVAKMVFTWPIGTPISSLRTKTIHSTLTDG